MKLSIVRESIHISEKRFKVLSIRNYSQLDEALEKKRDKEWVIVLVLGRKSWDGWWDLETCEFFEVVGQPLELVNWWFELNEWNTGPEVIDKRVLLKTNEGNNRKLSAENSSKKISWDLKTLGG